MEWSAAEIICLHQLVLSKGIDQIGEIARALNRSKNAVIAALRKMMAQQMIYHSHTEVARNYDMSDVELSYFMGHRKFYVPINEHPIPTSVYMISGLIIASGLARFGHIIMNSPLLSSTEY